MEFSGSSRMALIIGGFVVIVAIVAATVLSGEKIVFADAISSLGALVSAALIGLGIAGGGGSGGGRGSGVAAFAIFLALSASGCGSQCAMERMGVATALDAAEMISNQVAGDDRETVSEMIGSARSLSSGAFAICEEGGVHSILPVAKILAGVAQILRVAGVEIPESILGIIGLISGGLSDGTSTDDSGGDPGGGV